MKELVIEDIKKRYNNILALKGVSFGLSQGEVVGFLGPNGAGKSTMLKILIGLLKPDKGNVFYNSIDILKNPNEIKSVLGYVPEKNDIYNHMTGFEYLLFVGRLRGLNDRRIKIKAERLLSLIGLENDMHLSIDTYSKGMRQKVLITSALLHNPEIILLDEPFSGLDVTSVFVVIEIIKRLASDGKIIIYASHILDMIEKLCSRVIIIKKGEILADDNIDNLKRLTNMVSLEQVFKKIVETENTEKIADDFVKELYL